MSAALILSLASACKDDKKSGIRTHPGFGDAGTLAAEPISEQTARYIARASAATVTLRGSVEKGAPDRKSYLALREAVAAARPFFTLRSEMGSEVLIGPPRSLDEGGGALGLFDAALRDGDMAEAKRQLVQIDRALRLIAHEIALRRIDPKRALQALSDASYDLGLILTEAYPGVPDQPDAVLADLRGTVDGIERIAEAAAREANRQPPELLALRAATRQLRERFEVKDAHALTRRAELVVVSGELGIIARKLGKALGITPELPYAARRPVKDNGLEEPIHALVIPGPRVDPRPGDRAKMAALGARLFTDPRLSKEAKRACTACHLPAHAFGGDTAVPTSLDPSDPIRRNTPPLLYTSLHAAQLWDGRFASAERQAIRVIHAAPEMGLAHGELAKTVRADEALTAAFHEAFGRDPSDDDVARALVAYEIDAFVPAESPLDRFARNEETLSEAMHQGFDVFVGKGRCARCHVPPLFGGSRPPDFSIAVYAALGVPTAPGKAELDPDPGRGALTKRDLDAHAFKTPTVRNVAVTAPFFHNGAFPTLEEVVTFYRDGGGQGLGITIDNQDPDVRKLNLSPDEERTLIVFMRDALRDPPAPEE